MPFFNRSMCNLKTPFLPTIIKYLNNLTRGGASLFLTGSLRSSWWAATWAVLCGYPQLFWYGAGMSCQRTQFHSSKCEVFLSPFSQLLYSQNLSRSWAFISLTRPHLQEGEATPTASSPTSLWMHGLYFTATDLHWFKGGPARRYKAVCFPWREATVWRKTTYTIFLTSFLD